jgi:hypothetical protein
VIAYSPNSVIQDIQLFCFRNRNRNSNVGKLLFLNTIQKKFSFFLPAGHVQLKAVCCASGF